MELKFQFDTGNIEIEFKWFEAFNKNQKKVTSCIQYEKASVLWNIASIYAQMGSTQRHWSKDGRKVASSYFQHAAGFLLHIRDTLCPMFKIMLDSSNDLHESTITACVSLMLAQAAECYYEKANEEQSSSAVTSMIAVYTSDLYDVCIRQSTGKQKFDDSWQNNMKAKCQLFGAIAHYHTGPSISTDRAIAERLSRLDVAMNMITSSRTYSIKFGGILHDIVTV